MLSKRIYIQSRRASQFSWDEVRKHYKHKYHNGTSEKNGTGPPFRMVLPPPNVTGVLHIGHALTATIQDAVCRYQRLNNRHVEWVPGFDHAGIATQTAVEKMLWKTKRIRRHELGNDDFLEYCEQWKSIREKEISNQLRQLGTTLDWGNPFYTMNNKFKHAVNTAFVQLERQGLIYRDKRIVNWCPALRSTISNEEVDLKPVGNSVTIPDVNGGQRTVKMGVLYKIRYKLVERRKGEPEYLEVATTRPESVFADAALAVNPNDSRFSQFIGRFVKNPMSEKQIPVITSGLVEPDFGTGVLKITPACSTVDYKIYSEAAEQDKKLMDLIPVTDEAGFLSEYAGQFKGIDRFKAKDKVIKYLNRIGAYGGEQSVEKTVLPICSRSGDLCEGRLMDQWFLKTEDLSSEVLMRLEKGELKIDPDYGEIALENWLQNPEPWCLSRQLLWGHRIPSFIDENGKITVATSLEEAEKLTGIAKEDLIQDSDVLDTWFSSALIPIVVAEDWPGLYSNGDKNQNPYALNLMETGHDITGFWVARMLITCFGLTGRLPFNRISLHGMIRDSEGQKMSKSKGNVIDPLFLINGAKLKDMIKDLENSNLPEEELELAIELTSKQYPKGIAKYGPDVLRFVLLRRNVQAKDVPVDLIPLAEEGYKFGNKLSNMSKYVDMICSSELVHKNGDLNYQTEDKWIRSRLQKTVKTFQMNMEECHTHTAFEAVFQFILNDFCDTYLESTKKAFWDKDQARVSTIKSVMVECVELSLKLWSTFMPMISNYILDHSKFLTNRPVIEFDQILKDFNESEANSLNYDLRTAQNIVSTVRAARSRLGISDRTPFAASIISKSLDGKFVEKYGRIVQNLGNVTIDRIQKEEEHGEENINVLPVSGTDLVLILQLDSQDPEISSKIHHQLKEKLIQSKKRLETLDALIKKYSNYATVIQEKQSKTKGEENQLRKHERKLAQTERNKQSQLAEFEKISKLVESLEKQKKERAN
ncbi:unnamed protein product [Bursaphelenchus okinawaensis]|uniref:valine--tRNA ligase n=1 Tax=Bursaphelenchus okinawaensis TaxID=465554 RepID=A0A811L3J1_9BILA|nr:unnamed protein product [Bursaphelenchus okinawaensis]CAG9115330.1 unnamed protein product [Bursaphelenchus okinawaensis]